MRVIKKRWGEVTIKKAGERKNDFDETKSFSIEQTSTNYSIQEYQEILKAATELTSRINFRELNEIFLRLISKEGDPENE